MTTEEEANSPAAAAADATLQGDDVSTKETPSSSKGIIATLTGVAMQLIRAPTPADEVGEATVKATASLTTKCDDDPMDVEKDDGGECVPMSTQDSVEEATGKPTTESGMAIADEASLSLETKIQPSASEKTQPRAIEKTASKKEGSMNAEEVNTQTPSDDSANEEDDSVANKMKSVKNIAETLKEKRLGEELDGNLDALHESISVAILAHRKDQENASNLNLDDDQKKISNDAYAKLRKSACKAYHALIDYGSSVDLSSQSSTNNREMLAINDVRRSRLLAIGRNLWMAIRNNPGLFNDMVSKNKANESSDFVSFEGKKNKAIAGGYARAIAARLVFLNYIDTRCSVGTHPVLRQESSINKCDVASGSKHPSLEELVFGLKLFSKAGGAILDHNRKDARASYDSLSLAASCFAVISGMAAKGNVEAAGEMKNVFDEAFDAMSMLPNAVSLFGDVGDGSSDASAAGGNSVSWQNLVLTALERLESFVDGHCNVFKDNNADGSRSASKLAMLQRFLPSLARLCYKHGSHFVKLQDYENAGKALHIALKSTNSCLSEIRHELEQESTNPRAKKGKQILHNLEAELVVVSIEAFYLLSVSYQASGEKEKALLCLDRIEAYMKEQAARDNELFSNVTHRLSSGEDFMFAEGGASAALEGPQNHFDKDKADIKNRAQAALKDTKKRHAAEKATLAFSRIMIFHKTMPRPSPEEESLIDKKMRELVELSLKFTAVSSSDFGSAQHAVTNDSKAKSNDNIFVLTLQAIRRVHGRRTISKISDASNETNSYADNYKVLLDKLPKNHFRRPFVMLDRLNAMLAAEYQVRERKLDNKYIRQLDNEVLRIAKVYLETVKTFSDKSTSAARGNTDTTLFVSSTESISNELIEETKLHFARAVSLYHSLDAHDLCAQWSDLLQTILQLKHQTKVSLGDTDVMMGQVMTVKAYALSMSGNHASGLKTAREAWGKIKTVDSMVNLFHCSLRSELKHHSCDTLLEFDDALRELLAIGSDSVVEEVLVAFPRLSNSCVENEASGGEMLLLGVQERWIDMLVGSKALNQCVKDRDASVNPEFSVFDILRSYLNNFEHVISLKKAPDTTARSFEALARIIDGVLKLMVQLRETKLQKRAGRRKKRKNAAENNAAENEAGFVLVWDDPATKKLLGDRSDCVWTAEQLWNIGNQLMATSVSSEGGDMRGIAADVFAASHDFCLMSEEEEGQSLSKNYLDYDVKFDPTKTSLPKFEGSHDIPPCDISSEFSGQCLLISVATAVDYAADCMFGGGKQAGSVDIIDVQILLSRSLHRLAQAQEELQLNCEDEQQRNEVNKMIALLALRCLLGVGDDALAVESLKSHGLYDALRKIHLGELPSSDETQDETDGAELVTLRNVKLMADLAEQRKMHQTSRSLQRLCAQQLSQTGKFVLNIGGYQMSLGSIQRQIIQSTSCAKEIIEIYEEIDTLVEKHRKESKEQETEGFYSMSDLTWLVKESHNLAVQNDLLGDDQAAAKLFAIALNLLPLCGQDMQCHAQSINAAYQQVTSRMTAGGDSLGSIWNMISD